MIDILIVAASLFGLYVVGSFMSDILGMQASSRRQQAMAKKSSIYSASADDDNNTPWL